MTAAEPRPPDPRAELRGLHHVAFASGDGEAEAGLERLFGLTCAATEVAPGFTERTYRIGGTILQLLRSSGPGVVERFVERRGAALHHVAVEVADIDATLERLRAGGVRLVDERARPGGGGTRIAFVHPSELGGLLLELVETQGEPG